MAALAAAFRSGGLWGKIKTNWLIDSCTLKVKKFVEKLVDKSPEDLLSVLQKIEMLFPKLENDITLRSLLEKAPRLPAKPDPAAVAQLFVEFEEILARLSPEAMSDQENFLLLLKKLHPSTFQELRADRHYKHRTQDFLQLKQALIEKVNEDWLERQLFSQKRQFLQP